MSTLVEPSKHPTILLADEIKKFVKDITCLHETLPLLMAIISAMQKSSHEDMKNFIKTRCKNVKEDGNTTSYSIATEDLTDHLKIKRAIDNATTAVVLIPRHFITSLVSQYDSFLGNVIRFILSVRPEIINSSDKSIQFTELINFNSIDDAREYIIEKEVENIIRKSHVEQFAWLKDKLGTPFNKDLKSWPIFIEMTERRNLYVHCDGVVSSQYLKICSEHKSHGIEKVSIGDCLDADPNYFEESNRCIFEIGVKLAHVIWRKLCPDYISQSDENIIEITYGLILNGRYDLAIRILEYFTHPTIKHANESDKRTQIVNLAQAYKWLKNNDGCNKALNSTDWSASEDRFKLAVAVLRNDYDEAYKYMRKLKHDEEFHKSFYKDWPLFMELRQRKEFNAVYYECYGEQLALENSIDEKLELNDHISISIKKEDVIS